MSPKKFGEVIVDAALAGEDWPRFSLHLSEEDQQVFGRVVVEMLDQHLPKVLGQCLDARTHIPPAHHREDHFWLADNRDAIQALIDKAQAETERARSRALFYRRWGNFLAQITLTAIFGWLFAKATGAWDAWLGHIFPPK